MHNQQAKTRYALAAAAIAILTAGNARADLAADLRRCALIHDSLERLACYDGLSKRVAENAAAAASGGPTVPAPVPAPAAVPAAPAAASAPPPAPSAPPPAESAPPPVQSAADSQAEGSSGESDFGLEEQRAEETKLIRSRIDGSFDGWTGKTEFVLENGQVWRQTAGGKLVARETLNPEVEIKRGFMGVYYMKVDGYNQSVKVKRIK